MIWNKLLIPLYARPDWKQLDERFKYYPGIDVENLKEPYVLPHIHHAFYFSVSPSDFPTIFKGDFASPLLNSIKYFFPSLLISNLSFSDNALTTETPTPCSPPETL